MKRLSRKTLSILLSMIMVFSLVSIGALSVSAASPENPAATTGVIANGSSLQTRTAGIPSATAASISLPSWNTNPWWVYPLAPILALIMWIFFPGTW